MGRKKKQERRGARNQGPTELSRAADLKLHERFADLANALLVKALGGNVSSAGLLIRLAECAEWGQQIAPGEPAKSLSERWSAEPEWAGLAREEGAEARAGSREPE